MAGRPAQRIRVEDHGDLERPLIHLRGFGIKSADRLESLDIHTIRDLLFHAPIRYEDYRDLKPIRALETGNIATVIATVKSVHRTRSSSRDILRVILTDTTGRVTATFFNQPYLRKEFRTGRQIAVSGRVGRWAGRPVFVAPQWEPLDRELMHTARLVPIYPLTKGIRQRWLRRRIARAVDRYRGAIGEPVPPSVLEELGLVTRPVALRQMHAPENHDQVEAAKLRLAFDELLGLQLWSLLRRRASREQEGVDLSAGRAAADAFIDALPFELTGAQRRAVDEMLSDMGAAVPMNRLLQGDVGSGKTAVAAAGAAGAVGAGWQAAMMAPTEILAEQHFASLCKLLAPVGYQAFDPYGPVARPNIARLLGSMSEGEKVAVREAIAAGDVDLVVGTHAVIQPSVGFDRLGLAVVDEQHRFGVMQRAQLGEAAEDRPVPHQLIMTATPIPRTLALVLNADLDQSVIDELPPGRTPIKTRRLASEERERAYTLIRSRVEAGEQAFVICPLVEPSEHLDAPAATEQHAHLASQVFPDLRVGLVHGRLAADDKDATMRAFRDREIDVLVSTSVIEVGVDVPNATVMLIDGADRFGLAQLHQFRGRVGRGERESWCLLLAGQAGEQANARLDALVGSHDGLELATLDLELRGPGDYFGRQQSGITDRFKFAHEVGGRVVELAHRGATQILETDPDLAAPEHRVLLRWVRAFEEAVARA